METPPWEASKRIARHDYGDVVWQSTQNPRSFLDSVLDGVGESPPQAIIGWDRRQWLILVHILLSVIV